MLFLQFIYKFTNLLETTLLFYIKSDIKKI